MKIRISLFLILTIILAGCEKDNLFNCFKKDGKTIRIEKQLDKFNALEINDMFNVFLCNDTINKVVIEGGENLLSSVSLKLENEKLTINDENNCNFIRKYERINIYLSFCSLDSVIVNGQSKLTNIDTLKVENFRVDVYAAIAEVDLCLNCSKSLLLIRGISGSTGNYKLRGSTDYSYIYCHGTAHVYADNLASNYTRVWAITTGDIFVNATEKLLVKIEDSGDIYYSGEPDNIIIIDILSTGKLICVDP